MEGTRCHRGTRRERSGVRQRLAVPASYQHCRVTRKPEKFSLAFFGASRAFVVSLNMLFPAHVEALRVEMVERVWKGSTVVGPLPELMCDIMAYIPKPALTLDCPMEEIIIDVNKFPKDIFVVVGGVFAIFEDSLSPDKPGIVKAFHVDTSVSYQLPPIQRPSASSHPVQSVGGSASPQLLLATAAPIQPAGFKASPKMKFVQLLLMGVQVLMSVDGSGVPCTPQLCGNVIGLFTNHSTDIDITYRVDADFQVGMTFTFRDTTVFFDGMYSLKFGVTYTLELTQEEAQYWYKNIQAIFPGGPFKEGDLVELAFSASDDLEVKMRSQTLQLFRATLDVRYDISVAVQVTCNGVSTDRFIYPLILVHVREDHYVFYNVGERAGDMDPFIKAMQKVCPEQRLGRGDLGFIIFTSETTVMTQIKGFRRTFRK
ncbi:hypothetical protein FOZ62_009299, partial [Perkinsus olseni]